MTKNFKCSTCGQVHDGLPMSFAAEFPDMYANMNRDERDSRAVIGSDQCIIDQKWFFLRGCLEIPVVGSNEPFLWGLWAIIHETVFDEISDCWERGRGGEEFAWAVQGQAGDALAAYPSTLNLKLKIVMQPVKVRPLFVIEEPVHPLAVEQSSGSLVSGLLRWLHSCYIRNGAVFPMPSRARFSAPFNRHLPIPTASPQQSLPCIFHSAPFSLTIHVEIPVPAWRTPAISRTRSSSRRTSSALSATTSS